MYRTTETGDQADARAMLHRERLKACTRNGRDIRPVSVVADVASLIEYVHRNHLSDNASCRY